MFEWFRDDGLVYRLTLAFNRDVFKLPLLTDMMILKVYLASKIANVKLILVSNGLYGKCENSKNDTLY